MAEQNPYIAEIFKLANTLAVPLVTTLATQKKGDEPAQLDAAFSQRLYDNSLNGSGPSDPMVANESSPRTMLDAITGRVDSSNPKTPTGGNPSMLLLAGVAIVALFLYLRR